MKRGTQARQQLISGEVTPVRYYIEGVARYFLVPYYPSHLSLSFSLFLRTLLATIHVFLGGGIKVLNNGATSVFGILISVVMREGLRGEKTYFFGVVKNDGDGRCAPLSPLGGV